MTTNRTRRVALALALTLATASGLLAQGSAGALPPTAPKVGMVCTPGTTGLTHVFNLVAKTGHIQTPDGNSILMWSYANLDAPDTGAFQSPGPVLCITQGETVVVNLHNTLADATSIAFPGQEGVAGIGSPGLLTTEAASGGDATYTFTASEPGTYLYESGSDVSKQVEMGLYGALIVRPAGHADWAYANASTAFNPNREFMLLLAEIDPDLHRAVEFGDTYDFTELHNRYFTINGRSFPDTVQDNDSILLPTQPYGSLVRIQPTDGALAPALIRMLNAGALNHPFHPHGNHTREIAQDGRLIGAGGNASTEHFGETIASGQTQDFLLRWDDLDHWNPNTNPLPVAQPDYRSLTFKDGDTYYSGNPYLGYSGTFPTGTTTQNICGEWYFPLHSHALDEFANFDAGFGGMGTLLRVDPPGGCFAFPRATKITTRSLNSGVLGNLAADDAKYYSVNSSDSGAARLTDWYGQFNAVPGGASNLVVTYKGRDCGAGAGCPATPNKPTTLSIWNWATSSWFQLGAATNVGTVDVTITRSVTNPPAAYIGTGTKKGQVRIRVLTNGAGADFVTGGNLMKIVYDAP
jgi:multicopper oxidase